MNLASTEIFFDNGISVMSYHLAAEKSYTLIVHFAPFAENRIDTFHGKFLLTAGFDLISVRKRKEYWYQDLDLHAFGQAVGQFCRNYRNIVCYGSSMGAYAALYFAGIIGANCVAISPLVSIHPKYPWFGFDNYRARVKFVHQPLVDVPKTPDARNLIVYDPKEWRDQPYVAREVAPAFPQADYVRLPYSGHPSGELLHEAGTLRSLVLGYIRGEPPSRPRDLMGKRAEMKTYLMCLANHCAKRRKIAWAASLYNRIKNLDPNFDHWLLRTPVFDPVRTMAETMAKPSSQQVPAEPS
jgi:pimeloyl-ACP methyl ester carboxylesterase